MGDFLKQRNPFLKIEEQVMIKCPSSTNETATNPTPDLTEHILPKTEATEKNVMPPGAD